ncbi:MAG: hypothetical protein CK548_07665 [Opitutia bacterium]|nr:MAG: hypothetical protein CK548_07665 [Opitutae bacterium]
MRPWRRTVAIFTRGENDFSAPYSAPHKDSDSRRLLGSGISVRFFAGGAAAAEVRPNIVVILADDLGIGDRSAYRPGADVQTPHLDRLAAEGMRLSGMRANATVCSPTRAALMSGRYADRVGVPGLIRTDPVSTWGYFDRKVPTIANHLRAAGYHTVIIGKWNLGLTAPGTHVGIFGGEAGVAVLVEADTVAADAGGDHEARVEKRTLRRREQCSDGTADEAARYARVDEGVVVSLAVAHDGEVVRALADKVGVEISGYDVVPLENEVRRIFRQRGVADGHAGGIDENLNAGVTERAQLSVFRHAGEFVSAECFPEIELPREGSAGDIVASLSTVDYPAAFEVERARWDSPPGSRRRPDRE